MRLVPRFRLALPFILSALLVAAVGACTGNTENTATPGAGLASTQQAGADTPDGTGTLEIRVTDAPNRAITAIYVTASEIQVASSDSEDAWTTVISEPITFELLALQGVEAILGESALPAGRYTQVRLSVPEVEVVVDGESTQAEVPSDKLRLVGTFTIEEGEQTYISLDFDAEDSLVERGPNGYLFKPVIKLEVGEPGEEGEEAVELPGKPDDAGNPTPTPTVGAAATPLLQSTPMPQTTAGPTATPDSLGAFFLSIESPSEPEVIVESAQFDVVGRTTVDAFVTVNDEVAEVGVDGRFEVSVILEEGPNVVEVVASTAAGDQDSQVLVIIYEPATS